VDSTGERLYYDCPVLNTRRLTQFLNELKNPAVQSFRRKFEKSEPVARNPLANAIVLLTKTGPRCISFRCKVTVSLAQGAVHDAEADVADPVFVRSTILHQRRFEYVPPCTVRYVCATFSAHDVERTVKDPP